MEEKDYKAPVPYFIHEGVLDRMVRNNKRLLIALVVAVIALVVNNCAWLVYENTQHRPPVEVTMDETGL